MTQNNTDTIMRLAMGLELGGDSEIDMRCEYKSNETLVFVSKFDKPVTFNTEKFIPNLDFGFTCNSGKAAYIHRNGGSNPDKEDLKSLVEVEYVPDTIQEQIIQINQPGSGNDIYNILYLDFEGADLKVLGKDINILYFRMLYASKAQPKSGPTGQ